MQSIVFEKQFPITNNTVTVFRKFDYRSGDLLSDGTKTLSTLLLRHTFAHIKIELSYFDKNKQRYAAAALTEDMMEDIIELLFNGNIVTIENHTYRLPRTAIRPRYRYNIVQVPPQVWHAEKPLRDKKLADFKKYRTNRLNFDHVAALCEQITLDGLTNKPRYSVLCKNPVIWYNAFAEYQFCASLTDFTPLTPAEQAEYDAEARFYGAPDPTICWHYDSRAIGLTSRKPVDPDNTDERYVYSNEIARNLSSFQSVYVTEGTASDASIRFAQKKYTAVHPALLRESYNYYRHIKDCFGDAGLLPEYERCPYCDTIFHTSTPCECFVERQERAQSILNKLKSLTATGLLRTRAEVIHYLATEYLTTLTELNDDLNCHPSFETKPDMSYYARSHSAVIAVADEDDIDFDDNVFDEDLDLDIDTESLDDTYIELV